MSSDVPKQIPATSEVESDLLPYLAAFANGRPGPPELELQHFATRGGVTYVTRARLDGIVEVGSVSRDTPRHRVRAGRDAIRRAAGAILASGFPDIALPPDAPPAPPTSSPIRLAVARGRLSAVAELPAPLLDLAPEFRAAVAAVSSLAAPARAGAAAAKEALVAMAVGRVASDIVIDVRFVADDAGSFTLAMMPDGTLLESERRGPRERSRELGVATEEERAELARAFLGAGFPDEHGKAAPVAGPHYVVRVAHREASVEIVMDADRMDEHGLEKAVTVLYAAAARFGMRPLELREDDPPSMRTRVVPARGPMRSVPPGIADQLLEFAEDRVSFVQLARWLAQHKRLWVLATDDGGGAHLPRIVRDGGMATLAVFTSEPALDAWLLRAGESGEPVVMRDTWGGPLFGGMPDLISRVDIDAASPLTVQIQGEPLTTLRALSRAVNAERGLLRLEDPPSLREVTDHVYQIAWRLDAAGEPVLATVRGPGGDAYGAAFTADDCVATFLAEHGGDDSGITMRRAGGREMATRASSAGVAGFVINQAGPGGRAVLDLAACEALASSPVYSRPPSRPPRF